MKYGIIKHCNNQHEHCRHDWSPTLKPQWSHQVGVVIVTAVNTCP